MLVLPQENSASNRLAVVHESASVLKSKNTNVRTVVATVYT